jgi:glycosyltransferase involved in cell wall biosynthesis
LKVLFTNADLSDYAGTQVVVRDLAVELFRQGHQPIVYSPKLGAVAEEIRKAGIVVTDRLASLDTTPDIIHGQHLAAISAWLQFPSVPAIHVCHGSKGSAEEPLSFSRVLRYVAVDQPCKERIESVAGIPPQHVRVIYNAVDLERFQPRSPLPAKPRRALVFSNNSDNTTHLPAIRKACRQAELQVDVIGCRSGNSLSNPEQALPGYDIVFAKARCALEAMAVGNAVVLCDHMGLGEMVSSENIDALRPMNFGAGVLVRPLKPELIRAEIDKYNAADAASVCQRIRSQAGLPDAGRCWIKLYTEVIEEFSRTPRDVNEEFRALGAYWEQWNYQHRVEWERAQLRKLESIPLIGKPLLFLARRWLGKWSKGWGLN